jgi:hypothetical protein
MKYEKYLMLEFSYYDNKENKYIRLLFTDILKRTDKHNNYGKCSHCNKDLKTTLYFFTRTDNEGQEEYVFGSECVRNVFQAGLGKKF